jgi:hypothetical protein
MQHARFIVFSLFVLAALSCSSGHSKKPGEKTPQRDLAKGKVIQSVGCIKDASVTYALYLPSVYSKDKKFPVIVAFDPHASGNLPVDRYKDLAEKYGYILIGSNNSKNGQLPSETSSILSALFTEIFSQYSVDTTRIYTMGFSGGARVASMIGLYRGGIAGIIGCGAGFPGTNQPFKNKCDFIGFAGKGDFNMFELQKLDEQLSHSGFRNALVLFDGPHFWPPEPVMEEAFYWTEFCAMKEKLIPPDAGIIGNYLSVKDETLKKDQDSKDLLREYDDIRNIICFADGLTSTDKYKTRLTELENNSAVKKELANRASQMEKELQQQKTYSESFFIKDLKWWNREITNYKLRITNFKTPDDTLAARRMLSYLSLVAYMSSNRALAENDTADAGYAIKIYQWVDPDNTEVYYLSAVLNARRGNQAAAYIALKTAIDKGFNDKSRMQQQPEFQSLLSNREFFDLLQKIK